MSGLYLFTGKGRAGLQQFSRILAIHIANKYGKQIVITDWTTLENCENFEKHPSTFSFLEADTAVAIIENLPDFFDYERLRFLLNIDQFKIGEQRITRPTFLFTSQFAPREGMYLEHFEKHYRL